MQIVIAAGRLREGVTEEQLIAGSDAFEEGFVRHQPGVLRRELVRDAEGRYADIVVFRDAESVETVMAAEQDSEVCAAFFALFDDQDQTMQAFDLVKRYAR